MANTLIKVIAHVHSRYSHDGELSLDQIIELCKLNGYSAVLLTEHAQDINEESFGRLLNDAARLTDEHFVVISGLEYEGEGDTHLLVFGLKEYLSCDLPLHEIACYARKKGLVVVVAHPQRNKGFIPEELVNYINGIEIWNSKNDGQFVPDPSNLKLLKQLRESRTELFGYGGLDLHWVNQSVSLHMGVEAPRLEVGEILKALVGGKFLIIGGKCTLSSSGETGRLSGALFSVQSIFYRVVKFVSKKIIYKMLKYILGEAVLDRIKRKVRGVI